MDEMRDLKDSYLSNVVAGLQPMPEEEGGWYTLQGIRTGRPTRPGIYIHGGKKVMIGGGCQR